MDWVLNPPFRQVCKQLESDFKLLLYPNRLWLSNERQGKVGFQTQEGIPTFLRKRKRRHNIEQKHR